MILRFHTAIRLTCLMLVSLFTIVLSAQPAQSYQTDVNPTRFDYGKMWALEYLPTSYIEETYGFKPDQEWLDHARQAAIRFATYCSASFVSPDGLLMTNHHCSRGEVGKVRRDGEDFDANGFLANNRAEERRAEGLFVKQLVQIADITDRVSSAVAAATDDNARMEAQNAALEAAMSDYQKMVGWEDLEIEPVNYYNGGRFSLYGYKKYDDVRLVWIPELDLGFYGGDPDNFTYPRYNLDVTFWRVYDENGQPLDTRGFYFPFNAEGAKENDPVFVLGNPGSTERYRTVAQLEYDRDYRYLIQVTWMKNRMDLLQEEYDKNPSPELLEEIFGISNSIKAVSGIVKGMHDPALMGRKQSMERSIKSRSKAVAMGNDYWDQIEKAYAPLTEYTSEVSLLGPTALGGNALIAAHLYYRYEQALQNEADESELETLRGQMMQFAAGMNDKGEERLLATLLGELKQFASPNDTYVSDVLDGRTPAAAAKDIFANTDFTDEAKLTKLLTAKPKKVLKNKDPMARLARLIIPQYNKAAEMFRTSSPARRALENKIGNEVYQIYGTDIPPDATFTLRIADGRVKGYDYNGTVAPYKTTYFGLYDRHFSQDAKYPWSLPDRWQNPSMELLRSPLNMVSTNDIIGGNSGSPIVNQKLEVVGLVFDGNIESLPGNFIFDETVNRTVSVHAGGIMAALKYAWKADHIVKELEAGYNNR